MVIRCRFETSRKAVAEGNKLAIKPLQGRSAYNGAQTVYFQNVAAGPDITYGKVSADSGRLIYDSIAKTIELYKNGIIDGICMTPITKQALHDAGYTECTEFDIFAKLFDTKGVGAVIQAGQIFRSTVVGHCAFVDIPKKLTTEAIVNTAESLLRVMRIFKPDQEPEIAVAALNPHAGENGLYGDEESRIIAPAIKILQEKGNHVIGPSPADTVFLKAIHKEVGGVVFLYHDQGNIAMKSVYFGAGVLIYSNIPAPIVSVGHGPAFDKAGKGTADPSNMIASIETLLKIVNSDRKE